MNKIIPAPAMAGEENAKYTVVYYGDHTCKDHSISMVQVPQPVNMDLQNREIMAEATANIQEPEADMDLLLIFKVENLQCLEKIGVIRRMKSDGGKIDGTRKY